MASFTNQVTSLITFDENKADAFDVVKLNGNYQSFIFLVLNLVRDTDFE